MKEKVEIRLAALADLPALQKVGDRLFDYEIKADRAEEFLNDPRHHLVLAYFRDEVVGMASGFHYIHPDKDPIMFVNEVAVLETLQNRGIGRDLVKYLCSYGKKIGCAEAWIATEKSNIPARKAYLAAEGIENKEAIVMFEFKLTNE